MKLSATSKKRIEGLKPDLLKVIAAVEDACPFPMSVGADGGLRTLARQKELLAEGKSKTLKSKHLTGDAVDLYPLTNDAKAIAPDRYNELAKIVKAEASRLGIKIYWGFDLWGWDKPHYQL